MAKGELIGYVSDDAQEEEVQTDDDQNVQTLIELPRMPSARVPGEAYEARYGSFFLQNYARCDIWVLCIWRF